MQSRFLIAASVATVAAATAVTFAAAERATFILTNGEKVSGTVVFHTDARTNIRADTRQFSLGTNDGKEVAIEFDHVAVIDFVSGTPPTSELEALKSNTHMLALKNGENRIGLLVDLVGGDTVRFKKQDGGQEDFPIRDVKRIYMATESARSIFNYQAPTTTANSSTTSSNTSMGRTGTPMVPGGNGIAVKATDRWTDARISVREGDVYRFDASGIMAYGPGHNADANGDDSLKRGDYPVPNEPVGILIGRVGNGQPFVIGAKADSIRMPGTGRLQLSVNDNEFSDNAGGFRVQITRANQ